ncbi:helix-turn-helix domain-containing protein [Halobacillus shinanisalinarum]|uniref:Helix-turn-helix domain-containing protein n=1 Tax=Halobacillus shinanisalinarum TaxID=2932258 RepID=A0ABY4GYN7_9BACI|nr:helix-turn-helix domain-containing protein [Halobacillus shinanisalinarum]UOQ93283.1 helix-turn-helix domain-containing protein [Halobacillus shinanisalinarum]
MEIGSRLREAREGKQLTLEEIQSTTKIQKRYLQAIENNEFGTLPGKFYTRAFIREYASAVGLNPEQVMEEHSSELPSTEEEPAVTYSRVQRSKSESSSNKAGGFAKAFPRIISIVLIIGALFAFYYFYTEATNSNEGTTQTESEDQVDVKTSTEAQVPDSEDSQQQEGSSDQPEEEKKEPAEEEPALEANLVETGTGSFPEHTYEITGAEERELTIEFSGKSYLAVTAPQGGEDLITAKEYSASDEAVNVDVSEYDQVYIRTGSAPGLTVKINDEVIEFPADVVTQKLVINFK